MDIKIIPAGLCGEISAISSKSNAHRLLISAALSDESCTIITNCMSKDILATMDCLKSMGSEISVVKINDETHIKVTPIRAVSIPHLNCYESGSTARFLLPIAASLYEKVSFAGEGNLPNRPFSPIINQMKNHNCIFDKNSLPFCVTGKMTGGEYILDGDVSSQFISGLLFALPLQECDSIIKISGNLQSRGYVDMTIDTLKQFGIEIRAGEQDFYISGNQKYRSPHTCIVEGDWSNSAFWLCAGAIGGNVTVNGLNENTLQKDSHIVKLLAEFGAKVNSASDAITVSKDKLDCLMIDAGEIPDLVPVVAAVAAVSNGTTTIYNAKRLKYKESDRLFTTSTALNGIGADITVTEDSLIINGKTRLAGGVADSFNDHRIAMAVAIAACGCENEVIITNADAVEKSYPNFFIDYRSLGGRANVI